MDQSDTFSTTVVSIQRRLLDGTWTPGRRLPSERQLAEELNVSRSIVREAMKTIEDLGLIEVLPRVGTFHRGTRSDRGRRQATPHKSGNNPGNPLLECLEARKILECGVVDLLVERATALDIARLEVVMEQSHDARDDAEAIEADRAFHIELHRGSRNQFITSGVERYMAFLWNHLPLVMALPRRRERSWSDHRQILDALKERDAERMRKAIAMHLDRLAQGIHAAERAASEGRASIG